ncbi:PHD-finger_domain-containing protein [Hexamita inflata]|uniref:PHD-finger domain-containing protein n=1 Tax=Hexamita inflata TaxID=28002 RepID=A0AA86QCH1_9EUKA|nr:PHD-finger domain-containing protein [Hexamita inflata]
MKIGEEDFCEICFSADVDDSPIIYCDKCDSCVHLSCAHLPDEIVDAPEYICEYCRLGRPACVLCSQSLPFHGFPIFDVFVHTICYRLAPFQYQFDSVAQHPPVDYPTFLMKCMSDCACDFCKLPGLIVTCSQSKCKRSYHPTCFILSKGAVQVRETNDLELVRVCCHQHLDSMRTRMCKEAFLLLKNETNKINSNQFKKIQGKLIGVVGDRKTKFEKEEEKEAKEKESGNLNGNEIDVNGANKDKEQIEQKDNKVDEKQERIDKQQEIISEMQKKIVQTEKGLGLRQLNAIQYQYLLCENLYSETLKTQKKDLVVVKDEDYFEEQQDPNMTQLYLKQARIQPVVQLLKISDVNEIHIDMYTIISQKQLDIQIFRGVKLAGVYTSSTEILNMQFELFSRTFSRNVKYTLCKGERFNENFANTYVLLQHALDVEACYQVTWM